MKKIVVLLLLMSCCSLFAQTSTWTGGMSAITNGTGTETNPYLIESANQLAWMAQAVNAGTGNYPTACYKMTINVDLNSIPWTPIGVPSTTYSVYNSFRGVFDGDGHTVANMVVTYSSAHINGNYYAGFFGITDSATIKNTGIIGNSSVSEMYYVGGIVGYARISTIIENCYNKGSINALSPSVYPSSYSFLYAGGIVAYCTEGVQIKRCYNTGDITVTCTVDSLIAYHLFAAGISAYPHVDSEDSIHIDNCYNTGTISVSGTSHFSSSSGMYAAGIVGCPRSAIVSNCYNIGAISASGTAQYKFRGGISAGSGMSRIVNSHYLNTSCETNNYMGVAQNEETMKSSSFVAMMNNGGGNWKQDVVPYQNDGFPILRSSSDSTGVADTIGGYGRTDIWTGDISVITHGTGTVTNPYLIESAGQLSFMAQVVNSGTGNYGTAYYKMMTNVDLNSIPWIPIGTSSNRFNGNFDGNGFVILNMNIVNSEYASIGLFGDIIKSTIKNVGIVSGIVQGVSGITTNAGGLVGNATGLFWDDNYLLSNYNGMCFIQNCFNNASVNGATYNGGILGYVKGNITMSNCYNQGTVSGGGAMIGYCYNYHYYPYTYNSFYGHVIVSNCYNNGEVINPVLASAGSSYRTIANCHYLIGSASNSNFAASQSQNTMKSSAFPAILGPLWSFDSAPSWNNGYPILTIFDKDYIEMDTVINISPISVNVCADILPHFSTNNLMVGFEYKLLQDPNYSSIIAAMSERYLYHAVLNSLSPNTTYMVRPYIQINTVKYYGTTQLFTTANAPRDTTYSSICQGEEYIFFGNSCTMTGWYSTYIHDTIQHLHLTVHQPDNHIINKTVCHGESYLFNDTARFTSGTYTAPLQSVYGCDSIVTLNLTVLDESRPEIMHLPDTAICRGDTISLMAVDGLTYHWSQNATTQNISVAPNYTTTYYVTVSNSTACYVKDTIKVTVNSLPSISVSGTLVFCEGNQTTLTATGAVSYSWNTGNTTASITVDTSGIYTVTGTGANGCSKSLSKTTIMRPLPNLTVNLEDTVICRGQSVALSASGGTRYNWSTGQTTASITAAPNATQKYRVTAYNSFNCFRSDTILITVIPIPLITYSGNTVLCEGESTTLTVSGSDNYVWSTGDTTAVLTVTPSTSTNFTVTSYYEDICSTQLNIPVTVNQHTIAIDAQTACNSFTWIDGHTYTQSTDEPVYTIENAAGCDSVVTLHLTVNYANSGIDEQSACDSYTWIDGHTYTQSTGSPTYTLSNASGCDSVVTLHLVIYRSTYYTDVQTACDSYTWINGVTYTYSTQTPTTTLINNKGCDSVITLHLTIYSIPDVAIMGNLTIYNGESTTLTAFGGNSYLWSTGETSTAITVSPTTSTRYYVTGTTNYGCASKADVLVSVVGSVEVPEYEDAEAVNIYPVPATSYLQVSGKNLSEALIYNTAGQLLMTEVLCNEVNTLSVSHLSEGVYFMRIKTSGSEIITRKFIISTY